VGANAGIQPSGVAGFRVGPKWKWMKAAIRGRPPKPQADPPDHHRVIDFGPLLESLGYYLRRLQQAYKRNFSASVGDFDVQARDVGALFAIGLNPGLTPSQLATAMFMDAAQVTAMLNAFAWRGWIDRRVSKADARSRTIHLTPVGQEVLAKLRPIVGVIDRNFTQDALTPEERDLLIRLLAKLLAAHRR
jgi:DNA-binding MarR family transcriptional regulator